MSQPNSRRQSDFKIHEDSNCASEMEENKDIKIVGGDANAASEEKDIGEVMMSQSKDPQSVTEERSDMEKSGVKADSPLDQDLSELQEDDSILEDTKTKHSEHDDCEDCKQAREEKRKRVEAREREMEKIEAEIKAAARKLAESIGKNDKERSKSANDHNDSILSTHTDESYEAEDHDDSLLSARSDESNEQDSHNGQDGPELTYGTTMAALEDDGQTEDEDSVLHHDLSSTDAETERGDASSEYIRSRDSSSHYGDIEDDVFSNGSDQSRRYSVGSADEESNRVNMSNRNSWQSNRQLDLSKEAQQLIELNSPIVGEEAATESVISRIPSGSFHTSAPRARESSCSPRKVSRHPFRTPSDMRAMQMYSPAPSLYSTPHSAKRQQHPTVSRLGTPTGSQYSKSRTPTRFKKNKEEAPLVLLHVTVLPLQWQYSKAIVSPELPANLYNIREAYYLLQEKLSDTILTRGILLPHPQDSYECLEERFLDALELPVRPRAKILRCGHYMGPNTTSSDDDSLDERDSGFGSAGRFKTRPDKIWCDICRRDVRYEDDDQDSDDRRFNIKIFASNGLMRAGAWAAAWKEMERVDIEIEPFVLPWMVEDMEDLIERLREAEERGGDDSFGQYSDDSFYRESLGSEAQRLHEHDLAKVTLRRKTVHAGSRNTREDGLVAASKSAEEEADMISREAEALRLEEEQAAKVKEEEARLLEEEAEVLRSHEEAETAQKTEQEAERLHAEAETLRIQEEEAESIQIEAEAEVTRLAKEAEEAQRLADFEVGFPSTNEQADQSARELEVEAQRIYEEEMALEEEAQRIHARELAEEKSLEEEAQRIYEAELAEQKALEEEAKKIMEEEEASRKAREYEDTRQKLEEQVKLAEEARLKHIYTQASTRNKYSSTSKDTSRPRTSSGDETLTELLVKAAGVALRDRKNVLILVLSAVVLIMALQPTKDVAMPKYTPDIIIQNHRYEVGNGGADQRGFEAMRQAAAEGQLPMMEIESSMGWKRQDVVVTGAMETREPVVVQSAIETKPKGAYMEIDAPNAPHATNEKLEEVSQIATPEVENLYLEAKTDAEVISKDIQAVDSASSLKLGIDSLPEIVSHENLDIDSAIDTSL